MLDTLTKESFEPLKGDRFVLVASDTLRLDLALTAVNGTGRRGRSQREHFSIHFLGPADPLLPQRIYRLEHQHMGALELFLVPIGRTESGTTYEAVFT